MAMNHQETIAAIEIHGRRNRQQAADAREAADKARQMGQTRADQHPNPASKAQIVAEAKREQAALEAKAKRCDEHASTAEAGYLLHGKPEMADCAYCAKHRPVIQAAATHGLMRREPIAVA